QALARRALDGVVDDVLHHRRPVDLADVADRHLSGPEAVDPDPRLHLSNLGVQFLLQLGSRHDHVVNAQKTFRTALGELHGYGLSVAARRCKSLPGILESAAYGMCEMGCEAAGLAWTRR